MPQLRLSQIEQLNREIKELAKNLGALEERLLTSTQMHMVYGCVDLLTSGAMAPECAEVLFDCFNSWQFRYLNNLILENDKPHLSDYNKATCAWLNTWFSWAKHREGADPDHGVPYSHYLSAIVSNGFLSFANQAMLIADCEEYYNDILPLPPISRVDWMSENWNGEE